MLEAGVQLHLANYPNASLPNLIELGQVAKAAGVAQLWVTDNLQSRNAFVVLSALAAKIPIKLGAAVTVQYFRNPVDVADAVAAVSELMDGRELSLGLARGNPGTPRLVRSIKPVGMLRETALCLRRLLSGQTVQFRDFPLLASYFNIVPDYSFQLNFACASPVPLYCGGNGPLSLAVGGALMDGIIFGSTFIPAARAGRMRGLLEIADEKALDAGRPKLRKVAEIKIYLSRNGKEARAFAKHAIRNRLLSLRELGYSDEDFERLGVDVADVNRLEQASKDGASAGALDALVTEPMIDAAAIAGDPDSCREKLAEVCQLARSYGFEQLMFSELGEDVNEAMRLLCDHLLPAI